MADTPTKPKPGSLRDRIAAFEKPAAAASSAPKPPPPRPKPGHVSWKPAPPSPSAATGSANDDKQHHMSANDAKESIGAGGSLKERMAALQGKVAFGGMGAPPPVPKPLKRAPLVVPSSSPDEEHEERPKQLNTENISEEHVDSTVDKEESARSPILDENDSKEAVPEQEDQDEEAKERERRAAIVARMARLGGARIGMAPPVIARKPVRLQHTDPSEEKAAEASTTSHTERVATPQPDGEAESSNEPQPVTLTHESIQSPSDSDRTPHQVLPQPSFSSSHSSLPSIPLPAIPKRPHGPPRHKISPRSSQSDPKSEETATGAISERSVQDTIDISSAVESNVHEQTLSDSVTGDTEELQSNSPEATVDTQSVAHPTDTPTEQDTEPEHEFDAHTGGVDSPSVLSPQANSEAEAEIATPETTTADDTDVPVATVIVEHSSSDEHKRLVVSMPVDIDHDGSDTGNTVTEHLEHAENLEDTEEVEEDTEVVVEDGHKTM